MESLAFLAIFNNFSRLYHERATWSRTPEPESWKFACMALAWQDAANELSDQGDEETIDPQVFLAKALFYRERAAADGLHWEENYCHLAMAEAWEAAYHELNGFKEN